MEIMMENMKKLMKILGLSLSVSFFAGLKAEFPTYSKALEYWKNQRILTPKPAIKQQATTPMALSAPAVLKQAPAQKAIDPQKLLLQQQWDQLQEQLTSKNTPFQTRMQALKKLIETFGIQDTVADLKRVNARILTLQITITHTIGVDLSSKLTFSGTDMQLVKVCAYLIDNDILPYDDMESIVTDLNASELLSPNAKKQLSTFGIFPDFYTVCHQHNYFKASNGMQYEKAQDLQEAQKLANQHGFAWQLEGGSWVEPEPQE